MMPPQEISMGIRGGTTWSYLEGCGTSVALTTSSQLVVTVVVHLSTCFTGPL